MKDGLMTKQRELISNNWTGKRNAHGLREWLYLFLFHRLTGSGINYSMKPSGYHNTLLFEMHQADNIDQMKDIIKATPKRTDKILNETSTVT